MVASVSGGRKLHTYGGRKLHTRANRRGGRGRVWRELGRTAALQTKWCLQNGGDRCTEGRNECCYESICSRD